MIAPESRQTYACCRWRSPAAVVSNRDELDQEDPGPDSRVMYVLNVHRYILT